MVRFVPVQDDPGSRTTITTDDLLWALANEETSLSVETDQGQMSVPVDVRQHLRMERAVLVRREQRRREQGFLGSADRTQLRIEALDAAVEMAGGYE